MNCNEQTLDSCLNALVQSQLPLHVSVRIVNESQSHPSSTKLMNVHHLVIDTHECKMVGTFRECQQTTEKTRQKVESMTNFSTYT